MEAQEKSKLREVLFGGLKMIGLMTIAALVGAFVVTQVIYSSDPSEAANENSPIELVQVAMLLASVLLLSLVAWRRKEVREGYALVAAFFLCMAIRECDAFFDSVFFHGGWVPFALLVAAAGAAAAIANWRRALDGLAEIVRGRSFGLLCSGFAVLFAFARLFGYKVIWKTIYLDICGEMHTKAISRAMKNIAEEGTELLGYAFIFAWALSIAARAFSRTPVD